MSKILVVDDDAHLLENIQDLLKLHGYEVTTFEDPAKALNLLLDNPHRFDAILLDWKLQAALDGDGVIKILRYRFADNFKTPVICISAYTAVASKHFMRLGAFDTLKKPFSSEELLEKLECALNKKPPQDPHEHAPMNLTPAMYQKNYMTRKIVDALSPGRPLSEVACKAGCSERTLYRLLQKLGIHQFLGEKEPRTKLERKPS